MCGSMKYIASNENENENGFGFQNFGEGVNATDLSLLANGDVTMQSFFDSPQHYPTNWNAPASQSEINLCIMGGVPLALSFQDNRRTSDPVTATPESHMPMDWNIPAPPLSNPSTRPRPLPTDLQYGSDQNFSSGKLAYVAPNPKESLEGLTQQQDRCMNAVQLSESAAPTRRPTPDPSVMHLNLRTAPRQPNQIYHTMPMSTGTGAGKHGLGGEPASAIPTSVGLKRKANNCASPSDSPSADGANYDDGSLKKRRKSAAKIGGKKPNLTAEQKAQNHKNSEGKRRGITAVGFDNLKKIVPGLAVGTHSRASMLDAAHHFCVKLMQGNDELRAILDRT